jgi:hypothetical protein
MRTILILVMFTANLAYADRGDIEEVRNLELDARSISGIEIESRAGSLEVTGDSGSDRVLVTAVISVPGNSEEKAGRIIANDLVLSLEKKGETAVLKGYFDESSSGWGESPSVRLEVRVPGRFTLTVDDSSGSITVNDVAGNIAIDDSSGSIQMEQVGGSIDIMDSSGSISVVGVGDDLSIEDGSGSIKVRDVAGTVTIDDGSGSISVKNVKQDLVILSAGSGSVKYANIQGRIVED